MVSRVTVVIMRAAVLYSRARCAVLCCSVLCRVAMLYYAMLCYAMLYYAMLCCAMLCYAMLYCACCATLCFTTVWVILSTCVQQCVCVCVGVLRVLRWENCEIANIYKPVYTYISIIGPGSSCKLLITALCKSIVANKDDEVRGRRGENEK
jgi:hypothetical protein